MKKTFIALAAGFVLFTTSCSEHVDAGDVPTLLPPTDITVERTGVDQVLVSWTDNSSSETGYAIYVRQADTPTAEEVAQVDADVTSYTVTGLLQEGRQYFIGVKAFNSSEQTRVISILYNMQVLADLPRVDISTVSSGENCIWGQYTISNIE